MTQVKLFFVTKMDFQKSIDDVVVQRMYEEASFRTKYHDEMLLGLKQRQQSEKSKKKDAAKKTTREKLDATLNLLNIQEEEEQINMHELAGAQTDVMVIDGLEDMRTAVLDSYREKLPKWEAEMSPRKAGAYGDATARGDHAPAAADGGAGEPSPGRRADREEGGRTRPLHHRGRSSTPPPVSLPPSTAVDPDAGRSRRTSLGPGASHGDSRVYGDSRVHGE